MLSNLNVPEASQKTQTLLERAVKIAAATIRQIHRMIFNRTRDGQSSGSAR